jgi:DNA-binding IclR family transcriptional regulator
MTPQTLAPYVLSALATAQVEGRLSNLETLVDALKVRRADVRKTVSALHREGLVDVRTMRLSLAGFALGSTYASEALPPLRRPKLALVVAA